MDQHIADGKVGSEGGYSVDFKGGNLVALLDVKEGPFQGHVEAKIDSDMVLDAIAKAIPGQIDDAVIAVIKAALKS